jgi:hypothetical protein
VAGTHSYHSALQFKQVTGNGEKKERSKRRIVVLGGVHVMVLALESKTRGFKSGRERWVFKGDKIPQHDFLHRESKTIGHVS